MGKVSKRRREPRSTPSHRGFEFRKCHGQHILRNPLLAQTIVDKAGVKSTDTVLEVGPGTGNLTVKLLDVAKKVLAYEVDIRMVGELFKRVDDNANRHKLEITSGDVLKKRLPYFDVCVSNTPYQISSPLVFRLLAHRPMFRSATLMFQREFAMRLVAKPGDQLYCRLSVNAQLLARVSHIMKVSRNNFRPPPKVESSVVRIEPRNPPPDIEFGEWDGMLRIAFQRKHRMLRAIFGQKSIIRDLVQMQGKRKEAVDMEGISLSIARLGLTSNDDPMEQVDDKTPDGYQGDDEMETEDVNGHFRKKVLSVLEETDFASMRAAQMSIAEFHRLLKAFHAEGVYFSK